MPTTVKDDRAIILDELIRQTVKMLPNDQEKITDYGVDEFDPESSRLKVFMGTCHCSLSSPEIR